VITITIDTGTVEGFPESFEWRLTTVLQAFSDEPDSPRVEDEAPDRGWERFEPG
jgi:hypothetical protein